MSAVEMFESFPVHKGIPHSHLRYVFQTWLSSLDHLKQNCLSKRTVGIMVQSISLPLQHHWWVCIAALRILRRIDQSLALNNDSQPS